MDRQFARADAVVDIWTVHGDGSSATNLTKGKFRSNAFPDLTADGSEIVFRSTRDGNKEIYLMSAHLKERCHAASLRKFVSVAVNLPFA